MNKIKELFNDEISVLILINILLSLIIFIQLIIDIKLENKINELRDTGIQITLSYTDKFENI